eukprot:3758670-Pleurochrysis_carterae.AAC.1
MEATVAELTATADKEKAAIEEARQRALSEQAHLRESLRLAAARERQVEERAAKLQAEVEQLTTQLQQSIINHMHAVEPVSGHAHHSRMGSSLAARLGKLPDSRLSPLHAGNVSRGSSPSPASTHAAGDASQEQMAAVQAELKRALARLEEAESRSQMNQMTTDVLREQLSEAEAKLKLQQNPGS